MNKICFLCGEEIIGKSTREHIIGDSFLKKLNLKNKKYTFNRARSQREYSRLKLPAHGKPCNNELGSRFEEYIISLLETFDDNFDLLRNLHNPKGDATLLAVKEALTQWLAKIYVGLVYWESEFGGHKDKSYQNQLSSQLNLSLLSQLQTCFRNEWTFNVPSSLYYFRTPPMDSGRMDFDFATGLPLGLIYLKFHNHLLVACIADGYLTEEWFTNHQYLEAQRVLDIHPKDCLSYLHPMAHIWSVRENLPVAPKLTYTEEGIVDSSREGFLDKPPICEKSVNKRAAEIYDEHCQSKIDNA